MTNQRIQMMMMSDNIITNLFQKKKKLIITFLFAIKNKKDTKT